MDLARSHPGPLVEPHFSRNANNWASGFESLLVCKSKPTTGFPAGGHPLCLAASSDGKTSALPPSAWIVSSYEKQNWFYLNILCSKTARINLWVNRTFMH
jgi:hypothetical protein